MGPVPRPRKQKHVQTVCTYVFYTTDTCSIAISAPVWYSKRCNFREIVDHHSRLVNFVERFNCNVCYSSSLTDGEEESGDVYTHVLHTAHQSGCRIRIRIRFVI